jgi:hypothetical protein
MPLFDAMLTPLAEALLLCASAEFCCRRQALICQIVLLRSMARYAAAAAIDSHYFSIISPLR